MSQPLLTTQHLSVGYRTGRRATPLLSDLNLSLYPGRLTALLGRNGIGKSTLLRAFTCAEHPLDGMVRLNGLDAFAMSQRDRSRLLGLVTTDRVMAGALTVEELVTLGRQPHTGFLGRLRPHDHKVAHEAMCAVGIDHKAHSHMARLSDGERQKAMIARALAQQTPIIVLDEPTAFLDVASRIEVLQLLREVAHRQDKAVLLSSHDVSQILQLADDLWLITHDRHVLTGPARQLIDNGCMDRLFNCPQLRFNPTRLDYETTD